MSENLYQIQDVASQFNEFDKALLFKMGVNDEDSLNSLLTYYRDRLHDIHAERTQWLEKLEEVQIKAEDFHKQTWELQKRNDEIAELQKSLTEAKVGLFDERQQVLKLTRENDALKIKEVEDRKKIQELLSLTEPVEETIVLQKDIRPQVSNKYVQNDLNIHGNKENFNKAIQKLGGSYTTTGGKGGKSVVKTIYLPNETLNTISQENECLKRQLERERENFTQQINTLREELAIRDDEHKLHYNSQQNKIKELTEKLQTHEKQHLGLTKEFFQLRNKCNESEKKLHEENELLRLRNTALANKLIIAQKQSDVENKVQKELIENKCEEYTNKFRNQAKKKDDSLQIMRNQFQQAQKIYLGQLRDLEDSLTKLAEKYSNLEKRRNLENQGFKSQIRELTKKIEQQEIKNFNAQYGEEVEQPSLTRSEKEYVQMKQAEQEYQKQKKQLAKQKDKIYGGSVAKKSFNKKTIKRKPQYQQQQQQNNYYDQEQDYQQNQYEQQQQQQQYQDEQDQDQDRKSDTVEMQELEEIKQQLYDLEEQLDRNKNN